MRRWGRWQRPMLGIPPVCARACRGPDPASGWVFPGLRQMHFLAGVFLPAGWGFSSTLQASCPQSNLSLCLTRGQIRARARLPSSTTRAPRATWHHLMGLSPLPDQPQQGGGRAGLLPCWPAEAPLVDSAKLGAAAFAASLTSCQCFLGQPSSTVSLTPSPVLLCPHLQHCLLPLNWPASPPSFSSEEWPQSSTHGLNPPTRARGRLPCL